VTSRRERGSRIALGQRDRALCVRSETDQRLAALPAGDLGELGACVRASATSPIVEIST
jgi:hypothetical protein